MKNTKKLLILFSAIIVLVATVFSAVVSASTVTSGAGTSIDEYTSKKVTAYFSFEDDVKVELVRGTGGIYGTSNSRPASNDIYTKEFSMHYFGIDYYNNNGDNKHCYAEPTVGDLDNVEETPANGYVAEFDIAFFNKSINDVVVVKDKKQFDVSVNRKDYLYVYALEDNGEYKLDENGKYTFVQETDADGKPVFEPVYIPKLDEKDNIVYKAVYDGENIVDAVPELTGTQAFYDEDSLILYDGPLYIKNTDGSYQMVCDLPTFPVIEKEIDGVKQKVYVRTVSKKTIDTTLADATNVAAPAGEGETPKYLLYVPVYKKQLDASGQPIKVNKTFQGEFDGVTGSFAVQMQNDPATQNKGSVGLFSFVTNKANRTVELSISGTNKAAIPDSDKKHTFGANQWLHVTVQYDAQTMLTHIYVGKDDSTFVSGDGEELTGRRLVGTVETQGVNNDAGGIKVPIYPLTFRLGSSSQVGEVGLDNFIGYQGTTVHNPTYLTKLALYNQYLYVADALANEESVATDRYQSYLFLKNDTNMQKVYTGSYYGVDANGEEIKAENLSAEDKAKLDAARSTYKSFYNDEMDKSKDGVYDALILSVKARNVELYKEYVDLAVEIPRLIDNVETRKLRVSLAEKFVADAGSLIDTGDPVFIACRAQIAAIKATLEGDSAAYEFVRLMTIFDNSVAYGASLSRLQVHFNNAASYRDSITNYEDFEGIEASLSSYNALKAAVESYDSAAGVMVDKTREINSVRFVSIVNIMKQKTTGMWANDSEEVEDLWYRAYQIIASGEYDAAHTGFADAKVVFDLAHNYFWNALQEENIALLTAKLDSYNALPIDDYIGKAGICTYVDRFFEFNAIDIDSDNEDIKSIKARNEAYKLQLETIVGDYKNLLVQNTTKFINVMQLAAQYSAYEDLKPLFDEATSYYYTMNITGDGINECVEQYNVLAASMKAIEADSSMFVAIVNGDMGYTPLANITDKAELYRSLTGCYACLGNLDLTYDGAAEAKAVYDAEYAEYTNEINVLNNQVDEAGNVSFAVRGNWDFDSIVAFVKNIINMIKE
ncbi:MAG: hypothetical protein IJD79_10615 [Clostridia bacterium]|nr:hypothetical protein [Clostridia bacterium]